MSKETTSFCYHKRCQAGELLDSWWEGSLFIELYQEVCLDCGVKRRTEHCKFAGILPLLWGSTREVSGFTCPHERFTVCDDEKVRCQLHSNVDENGSRLRKTEGRVETMCWNLEWVAPAQCKRCGWWLNVKATRGKVWRNMIEADTVESEWQRIIPKEYHEHTQLWFGTSLRNMHRDPWGQLWVGVV